LYFPTLPLITVLPSGREWRHGATPPRPSNSMRLDETRQTFCTSRGCDSTVDSPLCLAVVLDDFFRRGVIGGACWCVAEIRQRRAQEVSGSQWDEASAA
jgi:hypothetical protein